MSITDKAMVVTLSVSCWTARKQDKKVTAEVEKSHGAHDAGRYNKLLVEKAKLDPLTSHAGKIRQKHYEMTLPWLDNGGRLLPSRLYFNYQKAMVPLQEQFEELVNDFISEYDTKLVADARNRLGTMYDPTDYPPSSVLRRKFGIDIDVAPVPNATDFRVAVGDEERQKIQEQITTRMEERQRKAMNNAWERVRDVVGNVVTRLDVFKPVIHESLMDNAQTLAGLLPGLNILEDPKLDEVALRMRNELNWSANNLRKSLHARRAAVASAREILALVPDITEDA